MYNYILLMGICAVSNSEILDPTKVLCTLSCFLVCWFVCFNYIWNSRTVNEVYVKNSEP
ncbi:rCG45111 [Rattus norvegicus]|uniref:RCG45111 n=1 Tax=Rattus norvegicus TaxID=10116 RepID=A6KD39_RAT|nr:rCG45111 [Rattus norvegicus]